jgi:hypothetical protein
MPGSDAWNLSGQVYASERAIDSLSIQQGLRTARPEYGLR